MALVRLRSAREHFSECCGVYYAILTGLALLALVIRALGMNQSNLVAIAALLLAALVWVVVIFGCSKEKPYGYKEMSYEEQRVWDTQTKLANRPYVRAGEIATALLFVSLCFGSPWGDVWVAAGQTTSLSQRLFWMPPFFGPTVYSVSQSHDQRIAVSMITKDGVPLECKVGSSGIVLDLRQSLKLEVVLLTLSQEGDPERYFDSAVAAALSNSAAAVLSSKTTDEVMRQRQFLIPYKIGTPMGDALARNILRWNDGTVSVEECALKKFRS